MPAVAAEIRAAASRRMGKRSVSVVQISKRERITCRTVRKKEN